MEPLRADTYGNAFADVYSLWYDGITDADATAAFMDRICPPGPIVELGVGNGRIAHPLAARGRTVIGLDASAAMLERCRATTTDRVPLVRADLAALPLRGRTTGARGSISGALCAFNTLFNLTTASAQQTLFGAIAAALLPNGVLVIEATTGAALADSDGQSVGISRMSADQLVLSATIVDAAAQTIQGQHVDITEEGIRLRPWQLRWTTPEQLDAMAAEAGLSLRERYADWQGAPFRPEHATHISVYG